MLEATPTVPNEGFHFDDNVVTLLHDGRNDNMEKLSSGGPHIDPAVTTTN